MSLPRHTILIVDDNQDEMISLKALLTLHCFGVDTASSTAEALRKIPSHSYALVIIDMAMSHTDLFDMAKDIPIIFLYTVDNCKKLIARDHAAGIDYMAKEADPDILVLKVKTLYRLRKEIELRKEVEKTNRRLEESNHELQRFAFVASHDLQEPLRKIQTFSGLALDRFNEKEEDVKPYLGKILASATRLRNLVSDLLQYSKIYIDDEFEPIDLNAMIGEIISDLELQIKLRHCTFEVAQLPGIRGIPFQIRQVFQNLLSNSIKFSKGNNGCLISVTGERVSEKSFDSQPTNDGKYCRIVVADNGVGFSNEFRDRIFEIFHRLRNGRIHEGTGIGLAIVKKVVERHDGLINAWGRENEGARFTIVLPVTPLPFRK
jgi:signal transduction histidine kinase